MRPPLGLLPERRHDEKRLADICRAISEYYNAGLHINVEWLEEYNTLISKGVRVEKTSQS